MLLELYSKSRPHVWPGSGRVYVLPSDDQEHTYPCRRVHLLRRLGRATAAELLGRRARRSAGLRGLLLSLQRRRDSSPQPHQCRRRLLRERVRELWRRTTTTGARKIFSRERRNYRDRAVYSGEQHNRTERTGSPFSTWAVRSKKGGVMHSLIRLRASGRRAGFLLGLCVSLIGLSAVLNSPAQAGESIWTHNGSMIRWVSSGQERWMYYLAPRSSLAAIGVEPEMLLFHGRRIGRSLVGTAYVFSSNCPPTPYPVEGTIYSETDVKLEGAVPVVDPYSCAVHGYTCENHNASLRFRYVGTTSRAPIMARDDDCVDFCSLARRRCINGGFSPASCNANERQCIRQCAFPR